MTEQATVRLTKRQREVLYATCVGGVRKGDWPSAYWRTFDQLAARGLVNLRIYGKYEIADSGRAALAEIVAEPQP